MKRSSWLFLIPAFLFTLVFTRPAQAQERRGWSPQAKGAVIGGAAGALGGVLINKRNRPVGGVIGGVGGAAVGFGVGKLIDSKRKKAAALAAERAAADERVAAANARAEAAERATAARRAETRTVVETRPVTRPTALGVAAPAAVAATTLVAANTAAPVVAEGYLPNPQYGVAGTAYPSSQVLRKSW